MGTPPGTPPALRRKRARLQQPAVNPFSYLIDGTKVKYKRSFAQDPTGQEDPRKKVRRDVDTNCSCGYPLDMWFEISKYIRPEDVGTFALICKHCYEVVQSARFWWNLYDVYCRPRKQVPDWVRPDVSKTDGLRAKVISALFFAYNPFIGKIWGFRVAASNLMHKVCVALKIKNRRECSTIIFKFQDIEYEQYVRDVRDKMEVNDLERGKGEVGDLERQCDPYFNCDETAFALKVSVPKKIKTDTYKEMLGKMLDTVDIPLFYGEGNYVAFEIMDITSEMNPIPTKTIIIEDVMFAGITNWYHPCFMHSHPFIPDKYPCRG